MTKTQTNAELDSEAVLRSLSHDLKEPIRTIRARINAARLHGDPFQKDLLKRLDDQVKELGDLIKAFRLESKNKRLTFVEIAKVMDERLRPELDRYLGQIVDLPRQRSNHSLSRELIGLRESSSRLRRRFESIYNFAVAQGSLRPNQFGVHNEIDKVKTELRSLLESTRADIQYEGTALLYADQVKFAQVLQNLFANAIRYGRPGIAPKISVRLTEQQGDALPRVAKTRLGTSYDSERDYVTISVADNGQGIRAEDYERIFELFFRGDNETQDGERGTGIGLAIVKTVINAHGGIVWVESVVGEGSIFHVVMPKKFRP